jgi:hypothetical protein
VATLAACGGSGEVVTAEQACATAQEMLLADTPEALAARIPATADALIATEVADLVEVGNLLGSDDAVAYGVGRLAHDLLEACGQAGHPIDLSAP